MNVTDGQWSPNASAMSGCYASFTAGRKQRGTMMMTVGNLMTTELVTVDEGTSVIEAAILMKTCNVESILVARQARIVGIVTESDIVRKFVGAENVSYFVPVEEIMNSPILGIEECRPLAEAADLMDKYRTLHLGVMRGGALIGVVSVRDFLRLVPTDSF